MYQRSFTGESLHSSSLASFGEDLVSFACVILVSLSWLFPKNYPGLFLVLPPIDAFFLFLS